MDALLKPTHFSALATGPQDAGSHIVPMTINVGLFLSAVSPSGRVTLPPNTFISGVQIFPKATVPSHGTVAPTAGTINVGTPAAPTRYANAVAANAFSSFAAGTQETVAVETPIDIAATALNGDVLVVLNVVPLHARP